jgi:hypothetical protein
MYRFESTIVFLAYRLQVGVIGKCLHFNSISKEGQRIEIGPCKVPSCLDKEHKET